MKPVVGRIIRNTRLKDTSLIWDIHEWLKEAMGLMHTSVALEYDFQQVDVSFFKAKYPCGLSELYAVEYCGTRVPLRDSVRRPGSTIPCFDPFEPVFVSGVTRTTTVNENHIFNDLFGKVCTMPWCKGEWYYPETRHVQFSRETGKVTLFFGKVPTDEVGLPLIPDNENYKQALYYYVRGMMIGTGHVDKVFTEPEMMNRFDTHASRAISEITYPSVDRMHRIMQAWTSLILPFDYFTELMPGTA